ncbi:FemAB family XrtA/PEP-CTERM system-associated protein [Desulfothermus naphthae]
MDVKIIEATEDFMTKWDEYVLNHSYSNVYQLYNWKKVIHETYGHEGYYIVAISNNMEIVGILPIVKINAYGFVKKFTSIPFSDLGGVLAENKKIEELLIEYALAKAKNENVRSVTLRQQERLRLDGAIKNFHYPHLIIKKDKVRLILELKKSSEQLFTSFKSKLRSQIRKPMKEGFTVKIGGLELVDDFYKVFGKNMRWLGSPVHSKDMIKNTVKYFSPMCKIFAVYKEKIPVACSLILEFKDMVYNPWASSLREYSRLSPNMLLYWSMLEYSCDKGYKYFDFGRSSVGGGTYRFKKQWGAEEKQLLWYIWSKKRNKHKIEHSLLIKDMFIKIWRKTPLSLTNMLGPFLRRYIDL